MAEPKSRECTICVKVITITSLNGMKRHGKREDTIGQACLGKTLFPLTAVHVIEPDPPAEVEPVEWLLLTTRPVTTRAEAIEVLTFYSLCWRVRFLYGVLTFVPYVVSLSCQRNANCAIVIGGRCGRPVALAIEAWY
ncbi:MAG: hypothetical protein OXC62_15110 [Aestuariivita sp.]|nr:hypothetical protein [Aestuariivita sp.]